jgi:Uma2 family endonuclease
MHAMDGAMNPTAAREPRTTADGVLRLTAAQFEMMGHANVFADQRVALRGGLLYPMNAQYVPHGRAKMDLAIALRDAVAQLGLPLRVDTEISVSLGEFDTPMPDIIVWEPANVRGPIPGGRVRILVEVADSTLADDLGPKRALYAAHGIPEYWVVDLAGRAIHQAWAPSAGAYALALAVPFGQELRSGTLEGLLVPTAVLG